MPDHITAPVSGQNGPGVIRFEKGPGGRGLVMAGSQPAVAPAAPVTPTTTTQPDLPAVEISETATATPPSPFERLYPGVDPAKVDFFLDDNNKLKYREIAQEAPAEAPAEETPVEAPTTPEPTTTPSTPDEITQLRTQLDQQQQLMQAMLIAQAQGRPLAEVLGLQAAPTPEPDYSQVDMYDPAQAANLVRDVVRAEIKSSMQAHQPTLEAARVQQEYQAAEMKFKNDPNYQPRMITALELVAEARQSGFPLSIEKAYTMTSKLPPQAATPTQAPANPAQKPTTLTPEQAAKKAEQAARMPQSSGVHGGGEPPLPENIGSFKDAFRWVSHQVALGNIKAR